MISPLPRNKRAKNPRAVEAEGDDDESGSEPASNHPKKPAAPPAPEKAKIPVAEQPQTGGLQNPFANLEIK